MIFLDTLLYQMFFSISIYHFFSSPNPFEIFNLEPLLESEEMIFKVIFNTNLCCKWNWTTTKVSILLSLHHKQFYITTLSHSTCTELKRVARLNRTISTKALRYVLTQGPSLTPYILNGTEKYIQGTQNLYRSGASTASKRLSPK